MGLTDHYFANQKNFSIAEIPTRYTTRTRGKSKSKFFQMAYKYFIEVIKLKISSFGLGLKAGFFFNLAHFLHFGTVLV